MGACDLSEAKKAEPTTWHWQRERSLLGHLRWRSSYSGSGRPLWHSL